MRLGVKKLEAEALTIIERDMQYGESFIFINKALNHFKIIYKGNHGIDMIEKKRASGQFKLPPVENMAMKDLMNYMDGDALLQ